MCGVNFKRHPPSVIGADRRGREKLTSWDLKANADANKIYGNDQRSAAVADIDLVEEHRRDRSGRTAAGDRG